MQETQVRSPGGADSLANGNPLQYSCLENSMNRGHWQTTVHGATKRQTQLSNLSTEAPETKSYIQGMEN